MTSASRNKILIIGSSGQVGSAFRRLLRNTGSVVYADKDSAANSVKSCDLSNARSIEALITSEKPTVIINCAAYTAVDQAEKEQDLAMSINAKALEVMAKAADKINAVLIHYSTDYVFDGTGDKKWLETDKVNPVNAYGRTKLAGEVAVTSHCKQGYVFRTQWVYDNTGKNFLNTMLRFGAEREELSVVGDQIGAPTSSDVIAAYTLKAVTKILNGKMSPGLYHLVCRGEVSWHGFAEKIFELGRRLGSEVKVKTVKNIKSSDYPTPAARPKNSRLSLEKFEAAIGEKMPEWADALEAVMVARGLLDKGC